MKRSVSISGASLMLAAAFLIFALGCSGDNPAAPTTSPGADGDFFADGSTGELNIDPFTKNGDPPSARNLIRNPGFEQGDIFWYLATEFWRLSAENPHGGDVCMRYAVPAGYNWPIGVICTSGYQIWLETGSTYHLSYWSRQDNPDNADQDCWVWCRVMSDGIPIHAPSQTYPDAEWRRESSTFVSPVSRPVYIEVWVSVDAWLAPAAVVLDDFALLRVR